MKKALIEFKDFTFQYKVQSKPTLHDINLTIYEGEKVLILGPSGSGKSTLSNCINGLIPFSEKGTIQGSLKVDGIETKEASIFKLSKVVGTVLQDSDAQFVGLSVGEDIAFALENENMPRSEMIPKVEATAQIVGMEEFLEHLPYSLSGGQKQKVALAGVMHDKVKILIFDEPLAALDPHMGMVAVDLIDRICRDQNKTAIIIEHRLEDVLYRPVDRIILMAEGRIVADMSPEELLRSELLDQYGIREPLYLTAMKYAGCNLQNQEGISDLAQMKLTQENRDKLEEFFRRQTDEYTPELGEPVIEVENVDFAYDKDVVVKNVNCSIRRGEKLALIGKNGAGKTTLARLVCGINRPTKGQIKIRGNDYMALSIKEIGEFIGYVMQNPNQMLVKDIIHDEVDMALKLRGYPQEDVEARTKRALEMCDLYSMRNWPVSSVSYGQRKRITIATVMALEPDVIILDEPTAGQDYRHYVEIIEFINQLNTEYGKTIILITHDMHLAIENTDRAIVFADGEIIADDHVFRVLSDDDVITRASLKQTSLYTLACMLGVSPEEFISHFISYERMVKAGE
ncbi:ABC transporter ATP-binding protein [Diplocloster modestus]|uniref:ABC transporter ATP-binding protein n=1 Tax=Diplocloster modestus TaxID=2850322 RepID=A0ABS6K8T7_9FIRM|nr:ABC transporter ATP-binding protein [Diplocloster modestus]MBU9726881.1 ABC transporter ATP-binding protein [Diplocloster modestus]